MEQSLARALAKEIETYAERLRRTHPLIATARSGAFPPEGVATYLVNARYMVSQTPRHMSVAAARSLELGKPDLAAFFLRKRREELGHDRWADDDLAVIRNTFGVVPEEQPSRHIRDMLHSIGRIVELEPSRYLAYTLFVEYLTVLLGPVWTGALTQNCAIPSEGLSVVTRHVELDVSHVEDELRELDALLTLDNRVHYFDVLYASMRYFELYCDDLYENHRSSPVAAE
jgi:pyrroloquinoline quinone (PQQ) biosynthesis protein C